MATEEELKSREAELLGKEIALQFMQAHAGEYAQTPENAAALGAYLEEHGLEFNLRNLEEAWEAVKTASPGIGTSAKVDLPPVPKGLPDVKTKKEINDLPPEDFKRAYHGPHGAAFKARIEAVLRSGL